MKKPYTKNKKTATKRKPCEDIFLNTPTDAKLARIERKLDELLARPVLSLVPCSQPPMPSPWYYNPNAPHPPTDPYGNPVVYCSANGGAR